VSEKELLSALDGGEEHRRVLLDNGPVSPELYLKALPKAKGAVKGRLLSVLGRRAEAYAVLSRERSHPRSSVWLAEELLHSGRLQDAASVLGPLDAEPWAAVLKAAALLGLGQDASSALQAASLRKGEEAATALALEGLSLASSDPKSSAAKLEAAAKAAPARAWPHALAARVARAAGDRGAALRHLEQAVAREPRAWVFLERSRLLEELGDLDRALADCDAAIAAEGESAELLQRRAHVQICRRHYHLAEPDLGRAAALDKRDARPLLTRATVRLIRGDLKGAVADGRAAAKAGGDEALLDRCRFETYAGKTTGVAKTLIALGKRRPDLRGAVAFGLGSLQLKQRDYAAAARSFGQAQELDGPEGLGMKAGFHRAVALGLALTKDRIPAPPPKDKARLLICGLGIVPPYTASLVALRMVAACDFVFNNLSEPEIGGLVWLLSDEGEPTMFDVRGADARWTKTIFRHIKKGKTTGFVTRGHPHVCGGLAASLIEECKAQGVEWEVYPAVSSMDKLAFDALPGASSFWGQQVIDWSSFFVPESAPDTRVPAVMYFSASVQVLGEADYLRFCDRLAQLYGAGHKVFFYGRSFNEKPQLIPVSQLRGWHGKIDPSFTLLIPPKE
jgi:tetratricopeptide (TPR) repeat protein